MPSTVDQAMKQAFMDERNLTGSNCRSHVLQLLGLSYDYNNPDAPPSDDHGETFYWLGKPLFYVYHPYNGVDERKLAEFCQQHGLGYEISPESWHFPGWTVRVTIYHPTHKAVWERTHRACG
jgi:hypothetical protein